MSLHGGIDQCDILDYNGLQSWQSETLGCDIILITIVRTTTRITSIGVEGLTVQEIKGKKIIYPKLSNLWGTYKNRQEVEGKKVHADGSFSGKGYKFDVSEAALANEKKKFHKAPLGLQD